jgi:hypothetical protein
VFYEQFLVLLHGIMNGYRFFLSKIMTMMSKLESEFNMRRDLIGIGIPVSHDNSSVLAFCQKVRI